MYISVFEYLTFTHSYAIGLLIESIPDLFQITFSLRVVLNRSGLHEESIISACLHTINTLLIGFCKMLGVFIHIFIHLLINIVCCMLQGLSFLIMEYLWYFRYYSYREKVSSGANTSGSIDNTILIIGKVLYVVNQTLWLFDCQKGSQIRSI